MRRRQVILGLGLAGLATPLMARVGNAHDEETDEHIVEYLFVQNADHAALSDGVLTLGGIHASTLYFSDRPDRITGHVTTEEFVGHWDAGEDSF